MAQSDTPLKRDPPRPDPIRIPLRLGCGALVGLFLGLPSTWRLLNPASGPHPWTATIMVVAAIAVVSALLSLRYGDRFWARLQASRRRWF